MQASLLLSTLVVVPFHQLILSTISKSPNLFRFLYHHMIFIRLALSSLLPCYYMKPLPITLLPILLSSPHSSSSSPLVPQSVHRQKLQSTRFNRLYIYTLCLSPQAPYLHHSGISRTLPCSYQSTSIQKCSTSSSQSSPSFSSPLPSSPVAFRAQGPASPLSQP